MKLEDQVDNTRLYNCVECHKRVLPKRDQAYLIVDKQKGTMRTCKKCFERLTTTGFKKIGATSPSSTSNNESKNQDNYIKREQKIRKKNNKK